MSAGAWRSNVRTSSREDSSKMTTKNAPVAPPSPALPDGESNRYLAKFKSSLCKRWSLTRMETLYEIADLALFLWALGRNREALAVASSVAAAIPAPPPLSRERTNYNIWCPATFSHALASHLATSTSRTQAEASRAAILRDAGISRDNPDYIAGNVADARLLAADPGGKDTIKWESQRLARTLGSLVLCFELAKAGDALFKPHAKEAADLIPELLAKLGARLTSRK